MRKILLALLLPANFIFAMLPSDGWRRLAVAEFNYDFGGSGTSLPVGPIVFFPSRDQGYDIFFDFSSGWYSYFASVRPSIRRFNSSFGLWHARVLGNGDVEVTGNGSSFFSPQSSPNNIGFADIDGSGNAVEVRYNDSLVIFSKDVSLRVEGKYSGTNTNVVFDIPIDFVAFGPAYSTFCAFCFTGYFLNEVGFVASGPAGSIGSPYFAIPPITSSVAISSLRLVGFVWLTIPYNTCSYQQIADSADAFVTGRTGYYREWNLGCNDRTVIPVPSTSAVPVCDGLECRNAAGMIDGNGNWITDGWDLNTGTQAIWVDPEEMTNCDATHMDGYFVFCTPSGGNGGGGGNCLVPSCVGGNGPPGGGGWVWDSPSGDRPSDPPPGGDNSGGGNGGSSSSGGWQQVPPPGSGGLGSSSDSSTDPPGAIADLLNSIERAVDDGFSRLSTWQELLANRMQQVSNSVESGWNWLKQQFASKPDPEMPELEDLGEPHELEPLDTISYDFDSSIFDIDTSFMDKLKREIMDSLPDMDTTQFSLDKILDSLPKPPNEDSLAKDVVSELKKQADDVKDRVNQALDPLKNLFVGRGSCNCLADAFIGLSFSTGFAGFTASAGGWAIQKICDSVAVIRLIVLLICAIGNIGLILWVLRR